MTVDRNALAAFQRQVVREHILALDDSESRRLFNRALLRATATELHEMLEYELSQVPSFDIPANGADR
jgi:hypothetical protein